VICNRGHVLKSWDELIQRPNGLAPICRRCNADRQAKYRRGRPRPTGKVLRAKESKAYAAKYPERRKAAHDKWIAANRDRWNAYMRAWRAKKKALKAAAVPRDAWTPDTPIGMTTVPGLPGRNQSGPGRVERKSPSLCFARLEQDPRPGTGDSR